MGRQQAVEAMEHLEQCDECAAQWRELRAQREALNSSQAGIDMSFAQQLLDKDRIAQIAAGEPKGNVRAATPPSKRPLMLAAVAVIATFGLLSTAYWMGEPERIELEFASAASIEASGVTQVSSSAASSDEIVASWVHPDWETADLKLVKSAVLARSDGALVLVGTMLDLDTLTPVLVAEQHGSLSEDFAELPSIEIQTGPAYVIASDPARLVWQSGDVVVSLTCECTLGEITRIAETFPAQSDPGLVEQVGDGLIEMASIIAGH